MRIIILTALIVVPIICFSQLDWEKKYDEVRSIYKDEIYEVKLSGKIGLVNREGIEIAPIIYNGIYTTESDGLFQVDIDNKEGLINRYGKIIILPQYDEIKVLEYDKQTAIIRTYNKGMGYGLISTEGILIQPAKYGTIEMMGKYLKISSDLLTLPFRQGLLDFTGNKIIPQIYKSIRSYAASKKPMFIVQEDLCLQNSSPCNSYLIIDFDGNRISKRYYNNIHVSIGLNYTFVFAQAYISGVMKQVILDSSGQEMTPLYQKITTLSSSKNPSGNIYIVGNEKSGLFDIALQKEITALKYDEVNVFVRCTNPSEPENRDIIAVKLNNKYGLIKIQGTELLPPLYDDINDYPSRVKLNGVWGEIKDGKFSAF